MTRPTRRAATAVLAATGMLALAACATPSKLHPLAGTSWRLVDVETSGTSTRLTEELSARHTIAFARDGRATMRLDCNRGNASWKAAMPRDGNGTISSARSPRRAPIARAPALARNSPPNCRVRPDTR